MAALRLLGLDWRAGSLTVHGKGNNTEALPLPPPRRRRLPGLGAREPQRDPGVHLHRARRPRLHLRHIHLISHKNNMPVNSSLIQAARRHYLE